MKPQLPPDDYGDIELLVIAGSTAYGLATPESDLDYKGFYTADLDSVLGLKSRHDSWVSHDPADISMHETRHFTRLALQCNPNIIEVLGITDSDLICFETDFAREVRDNMDAFFHTKAVRNAYGGYAASQFNRLQRRNGTFSADTAKRTAKHARHLLRLLLQGRQILTTGTLDVRVTPEQRTSLFEFGELPYEEMIERAEALLKSFDEVKSVLPDEPDFHRVNGILMDHYETKLRHPQRRR